MCNTMTKPMPLTQGQFAVVDDADFDWLSQWKWYAQRRQSDGRYIARGTVNGKHVQMHRLILGAAPTEQVDHKDQDTLNNQRVNLRICTTTQNNHNRGNIKKSKSPYKGVAFSPGGACAGIRKNGRRVHLGYFATELDAARAYDYAAYNQHGEFARLNFPDDVPPQFVSRLPDRRHSWRRDRREAIKKEA